MKPHIKIDDAVPSVKILFEDFDQIDILEENSSNHIRYKVDTDTCIITEKNITTNKILSRFTVFLLFEKNQITQMDILRTAIKMHHLDKYHSYKDHLFKFLPA